MTRPGTTDALVAMVRSHRVNEDYPTAETLLAHLPVVLRALCDYVLTGQATALEHGRPIGFSY